nr:copper amine oxidase N-terminal domain-containing protein [Clostridium sp. MD294]
MTNDNQNTNIKQNTENEKNINIEIKKEDNYTEQEKAEILNTIQQLQQQQITFLEPWHITFQYYDVKLLSPICVIEQQIYVPAQELARQIGAKVYKGNVNKDYILKDNGILIQYYLGEQIVFVNGEEIKVSVAPTVYNNKAYLPLSIFEKAYGMEHIQNGNDIIVYKI